MSDNVLGQSFTSKTLLKYALPTIIMMVFTSTYGIIDGLFVANFVSENALAAVNIVFPIIGIMLALAMMLATGSNALIGKLLGEGKGEEARGVLSLIYIVAIIFSIAVGLIMYVFADPLIRFMGANEVLYPYALDYMLTITGFIPCAMLQIFTQCYFVTAGKPFIGFAANLAGGLTNIILDYLLIVVFDLGIVGAGLATCIGFSVSGIFGVLYFAFCRKGTLYFVKPSLNIKHLTQSLYNGMSEFVTMMSMSITTIMFNVILMNIAGENGVAGITVIMYIQTIQSAIYMGYSMGVAPVISYKFGEQSFEQLKLINLTSLKVISVLSLITIALSLIFAKPAVGIFISPESETFALTVTGLRIYSLAYVGMGFNIYISAMFTALSNGKVSAIVSIMRTLVFIVIALLTLPFIFGITGVWIAVPIAEMLGIGVGAYCFNRYKTQYNYY